MYHDKMLPDKQTTYWWYIHMGVNFILMNRNDLDIFIQQKLTNYSIVRSLL